jgi:molybdopterin/thiamine biosynthesis adenylyltransferase
VEVTAIVQSIDAGNIISMIENSDIVLDGLDSLSDRQIVADACSKLGIPFIHGAIAGFNGQIMAIFPGEAGLASLYRSDDKNDIYGMESITGMPPATPAIIAAWQVQEAIKILTGLEQPRHNQFLMLDFLSNSLEIFNLK